MGRIEVKGLSKAYRQYKSKWGRALEWIAGGQRHSLKWVLKDINFVVEKGEAVGIIGVNGAGKSTLLKLLVKTAHPTAGSVETTGRVAALLELGMGFHPDFTGRQNVFMSGSLLGLKSEEIAALMPSIEAFAEIGEYIDEPVRIYSSGMQVRLAFSVATAARPDILIVDEALSVGDAYFQHKSFSRIRELREHGTTLLIVSHDKQAIQSICDRAILIDGGVIAKEGAPEEVMDYYNALIAQKENSAILQSPNDSGRVGTCSGTGEAKSVSVELFNSLSKRAEVLGVGEEATLIVRAKVFIELERLVCGFMIKDRLGQPIFGTNTFIKEKILYGLKEGEEIEFRFAFAANVGVGAYSVATALVSGDTHLENNYEWRDLALTFSVVNIDKEHFVGSSWLACECEVVRA